MSAYRFCRTDDIPLLVDALNRCWRPCVPGEPVMTIARFKREIRDLQIWCSSCMVAFAGSAPIGVMTGAKRAGETLVHRIAVHPGHRRQGHGRHLLTSLRSKLSILGPPRIVAEVPDAAAPVQGLFAACGFTRDGACTDYVLDSTGAPADSSPLEAPSGWLMIPVTVDDLLANGLLGESDSRICWARRVETLAARKNEIDGLAIATEERIEACLLYASAEATESAPDGTEILVLRSEIEDAGARLRLLVGRLIGQGRGPLRITKVHPLEVPAALMDELGFRPVGGHIRYAATAREARGNI